VKLLSLPSLLFLLSLSSVMSAAEKPADKSDKPSCVAIEKAREFVGQEVCVIGKVYRVGFSNSGTALITFCEEYRNCPFSAVVFSRDVEKVGNLQMFEGRELEVTGRVRDFHGEAEIVVKTRKQFSGEALSPRLGRDDVNPRSGNWHR
jgi:DNA/RNA endonuclease YhcR with UshA esterase domain